MGDIISTMNPTATKILHILQTHHLAVIATTTPAHLSPESALIAFTEDNNLNLYFQTASHSRKAANLAVHPYVSLVIGLTLENLITVQYEGKAVQLTHPAAVTALKLRFLTKNSPTTAQHLNRPDTIFFQVIPSWIGYSDYSGTKPDVTELSFPIRP